MLGLIEETQEAAEQQAEVASSPEPEEQPHEEADVSPSEAPQDGGDPQPPEEGEPGLSGEEQAPHHNN